MGSPESCLRVLEKTRVYALVQLLIYEAIIVF